MIQRCRIHAEKLRISFESMKTVWHGENRVRHIEKLKGSFLSLKAKKSNTIKNEIFHKYYLCWPSIFRTFPQV